MIIFPNLTFSRWFRVHLPSFSAGDGNCSPAHLENFRWADQNRNNLFLGLIGRIKITSECFLDHIGRVLFWKWGQVVLSSWKKATEGLMHQFIPLNGRLHYSYLADCFYSIVLGLSWAMKRMFQVAHSYFNLYLKWTDLTLARNLRKNSNNFMIAEAF